MTNFDAIVALWGVIQPLLIQWVAGDIHSALKWFVIITTSLLSGIILLMIQDGGLSLDSSLINLFWIVVKVLAFSLGSWGSLWKKIFPNKDNPLTVEKEGQKLYSYTVTLGYEGIDRDIDVIASNRYEATKKAIETLKDRLEVT